MFLGKLAYAPSLMADVALKRSGMSLEVGLLLILLIPPIIFFCVV